MITNTFTINIDNMIYSISILLLCSIYVATFVFEKNIFQQTKRVRDAYLEVRKTPIFFQIICFLLTLFLFILFSPINFLFILYIQLKNYGKD